MNYSKMKVNELREMYTELSNENKEKVQQMTKKELVEKLVEIDNSNAQLLDAIEEDTNEKIIEKGIETSNENTEKLMPAYASPQWHDYVMSKFTEDELQDGAPTCDGCRRVVEEIIGVILNTRIQHYIPPSQNNNGTAAVVVGLTILVTNESHPAYSKTIYIEDIADVNAGNTEYPYNRYLSATAATRAEGRALRKILRLKNTCVAEELSNVQQIDEVQWSQNEPITNAQINVIDMMCSRMNINTQKFINSGSKNYSNIREVTKDIAAKMIKELNSYQQNKKNIPEYIIGYKKSDIK